MGNRAIVTFVGQDKMDASPAIYLHWNGGNVVDWLNEAAPRLRKGDPWYAAARFCGFCHDQMDGALSLGLFNAGEAPEPDNGQSFIVDTESGAVLQNAVKVAQLEMYEG